MTNTVTNEQIDSLLDALDCYESDAVERDYGVVRRWLEMISPAAEPGAEPDLALDRTGPFCNEHLTDVRAWCVECLLTTNERRALKPGAYR